MEWELEIIGYLKGQFIGYKWSATKELPELNILEGENIDWSGFYTCLDYDTAKGYLQNRLSDVNTGTGIVYMHEIYLKSDLPIIRCSHSSFKDGSYKYTGILEQIKKKLITNLSIQTTNETPFLPKLGEIGYGFQCFHDLDGTEEIVIPHALKSCLDSKVMREFHFKKYEICKEIDF